MIIPTTPNTIQGKSKCLSLFLKADINREMVDTIEMIPIIILVIAAHSDRTFPTIRE